MNVTLQTAAISYCPDLTDPNGQSIPIAVLAIGNYGNGWVATAAGVDAKRLGLDPMSSAMLSDVPHLIRRHVDAAVRDAGFEAGPEAIFAALADTLRTSIHVSDVSGIESREIETEKQAAQCVVDHAVASLVAAIDAWRSTQSSAPRLAMKAVWHPLAEPEDLVQPTPDIASWAIHRLRAEESTRV